MNLMLLCVCFHATGDDQVLTIKTNIIIIISSSTTTTSTTSTQFLSSFPSSTGNTGQVPRGANTSGLPAEPRAGRPS
jgi:hypothetical protein